MESKKLTLLSLLLSISLVLGYFEHLIPLPIAIPGIKLGLSNIVLIYALYFLGTKEAFSLMIMKVILSGLLFAGVSGAMYAFSGGLSSLIVMSLVKNITGVSVLGVSIIGSVFHNVGQITLASLIIESKYIFFYLPILLVSSVITGIITGLIAKYVMHSLKVISMN